MTGRHLVNSTTPTDDLASNDPGADELAPRAPAAASGAPGSAGDAARAGAHLQRFAHPQWMLARFIARGTARTAAVWGTVIGLYIYASTVGFVDLAPTAAGRHAFVAALSGNTGLKALMGDPYRIDTVGGFVTWRVTGVVSLIGAIWGLLLATRVTRGEEAAGRMEPFLAGGTTQRRAAANVLAGLGSALIILWAITAIITIAVGRRPEAHFGIGPSLLLATAVICAAAEFMLVGAVAGQVMPIRARAAGLAAGVFGVAFLLRAVADVAPAAHGLIYASPLGWPEQIRALSDPRPIWLLPIGGFVAALAAATVWLAGNRDLGASLLADQDVAPAHTRLLGSHGLLAVRLTRTSSLVWTAVVGVSCLLYGSFARSAGDAFASSSVATRMTGQIARQAQQTAGIRLYAGVIFLMVMLILMGYVASAAGNVREQEAEGYLDNLLVRGVQRTHWLAVRTLITLVVTCVAGLAGGVGFWLGAGGHGLGLGELAAAGLNAASPAVLLLGICVLVTGFAPRWTTPASFGILAWSFLLDMLGAVIHLNHWILDTSLLQHPALAPATDPNWQVAAIYLVAAVALAALGAARFSRRDLQTT